jgi:acyl-CoA synthetase (AMP-forming)/AMP-acid ligase II
VSNLVTVFEETVQRFGDRIAVEVQRKDALDRFTYTELHRLALDRLRWLHDAGIQPGDRCAILAHNDAHWCAAYLAILKAGAIVVPFDTNYSAGQVATILRDSGARVLFASDRLDATAREATAGLDVRLLDVHAASGPVDPVPPRRAVDSNPGPPR